MRKGEIAWNKQFLLFLQCFLPYVALIFSFSMHFKMLSAICFSLDLSKILSSGNELMFVRSLPYNTIVDAYALSY